MTTCSNVLRQSIGKSATDHCPNLLQKTQRVFFFIYFIDPRFKTLQLAMQTVLIVYMKLAICGFWQQLSVQCQQNKLLPITFTSAIVRQYKPTCSQLMTLRSNDNFKCSWQIQFAALSQSDDWCLIVCHQLPNKCAPEAESQNGLEICL